MELKLSNSVDDNQTWVDVDVETRQDFRWQKFSTIVTLPPGTHQLTARATSSSGLSQPMSERRNHVHRVEFEILRLSSPPRQILAPGLYAPDILHCVHWSRIKPRGEIGDKFESDSTAASLSKFDHFRGPVIFVYPSVGRRFTTMQKLLML
jgi:hypothetical protein